MSSIFFSYKFATIVLNMCNRWIGTILIQYIQALNHFKQFSNL